MAFDLVEAAIPGAEAFRNSTHAGLLSQAGILLSIGAAMRQRPEILPEEARDLGVPAIATHIATRETSLAPAVVRGAMTRELGERNFSADVNEPVQSEVAAMIFERMARRPDPVWTGGLLEACLRHPEAIVRVAAAAAYHAFTTEKERVTQILVQGTRNDEPLVRELAATALAQVSPDHPRLGELRATQGASGTDEESHTTLLVHGTFARQDTWWQPGGDFHKYLTGLLPKIPRTPNWSAPYAAGDRFEWSGGYSDEARSDAARELLTWVNDHRAQGLDLITHSYGGDVAMLATKLGLEVRDLVVLSCPVLPAIYFPDFGRVMGRVVSFRVRMDLVLLADALVSGAEPKFTDVRIEEHILPLWFDHSATHEPRVWRNPKDDIPPRI